MSGFCFCYSKKALGKIIIAMKQNCKVEKRILSVAVIKSFQDTITHCIRYLQSISTIFHQHRPSWSYQINLINKVTYVRLTAIKIKPKFYLFSIDQS